MNEFDNPIDGMTVELIREIMKGKSESFPWQHEANERHDPNQIKRPILKFLSDYSNIHGKTFDRESWEIYIDICRGGVWQERQWNDPRDAITKVCHMVAYKFLQDKSQEFEDVNFDGLDDQHRGGGVES